MLPLAWLAFSSLVTPLRLRQAAAEKRTIVKV